MSPAFNIARDHDHFSLRFNIVKVSHAIVIDSSTSTAWTHLTAADLFLILDGHQSLTPLQLTVLHGNTCIEDVELSRLIDAATAKQQSAARGQLAVRIDQLPIFAIARECRLALRYDLPNGRVGSNEVFPICLTDVVLVQAPSIRYAKLGGYRSADIFLPASGDDFPGTKT
nr:hypothetical protein CFP56_13291 [Quercus suber]